MLVTMQTPMARHILVYINGTHHFRLIEPIFKQNPDIEFYIFSAGRITPDDFRRSSLYTLENVHFAANLQTLKYKFNLFGAFISTDAHAARAHVPSLRLIRIFRKIGIPILELQHGMFQIGLHYYDVPYKEIINDDSLPTKSFADIILGYYHIDKSPIPLTVIGYPPFANVTPQKDNGEYTLILSNLHWNTYAHQEKHTFYWVVFKYAYEHPDEKFIWKMHPAEIRDAGCNTLAKELFAIWPGLKARFLIHHENPVLSKITIDELILNSKRVISTVSTVLLDCEMYAKNVAVYTCPSIKCLTDSLAKTALFSDYETLQASLSCSAPNFKSGLLRPYDNITFRKTIDKYYRIPDISQDKWLDLVLSELQETNNDVLATTQAMQSQIRAIEKNIKFLSEKITTIAKQIQK